MKIEMNWAIPGVAVILLLAMAGCSGQRATISTVGGDASIQSELARVSEVRRLLRSACRKLRAASSAPESAALLAQAQDQTEPGPARSGVSGNAFGRWANGIRR